MKYIIRLLVIIFSSLLTSHLKAMIHEENSMENKENQAPSNMLKRKRSELEILYSKNPLVNITIPNKFTRQQLTNKYPCLADYGKLLKLKESVILEEHNKTNIIEQSPMATLENEPSKVFNISKKKLNNQIHNKFKKEISTSGWVKYVITGTAVIGLYAWWKNYSNAEFKQKTNQSE